MSDSNSLNYTTRRLFGEFLDLEGLTEIAVNRPGELFTKIRGQWERHEVPLTLDDQTYFIGNPEYRGTLSGDYSTGLSAGHGFNYLAQTFYGANPSPVLY